MLSSFATGGIIVRDGQEVREIETRAMRGKERELEF